MSKPGKRFRAARETIDRDRAYPIEEAVKLVKNGAKAKFDETIEVAMNLGVDPRHADQMVRGVCQLPNGIGPQAQSGGVRQGAQGRGSQEGRRRYRRRGGSRRAGAEGHHRFRPLHRYART